MSVKVTQTSEWSASLSRTRDDVLAGLATLSIQAVKSISLRNLVLSWQKLESSARLPCFDDFRPGERAHDPQRIVVWRVKERGGVRTFAPAFKGAHIMEALGQRIYLELIASQALREIITSGLEDCAVSRGAVYMTIEAPDGAGHPIECERLLLPFGGSDGGCTHIFVGLEISSLTGKFDRKTVFKQFEQQSRITLRGRIV